MKTLNKTPSIQRRFGLFHGGSDGLYTVTAASEEVEAKYARLPNFIRWLGPWQTITEQEFPLKVKPLLATEGLRVRYKDKTRDQTPLEFINIGLVGCLDGKVRLKLFNNLSKNRYNDIMYKFDHDVSDVFEEVV